VPSVTHSEKPLHTPIPFRVPREFPSLARLVAAHAAPNRWEILYRVLWRLTHGERQLLHLFTDPDVHSLRTWEKAVRRELHKLTAFVRFRLVRSDDGSDHYIAWYEPEHDVIALGAPFFQRRFASMRWSILSPRRCMHWDSEKLYETPGVSRDSAPTDDTLEPLWRTYYGSIFNPARLKVPAMLREMPRRYWTNLPEAELIEKLIAGALPRTEAMLADSHSKTPSA
jgi:DNA polymerase